MGRIAGKVAIVTGGGSGIGEAVSRRFVAEGAKVLITDVHIENGTRVARDLGDKAFFVHADATNVESWTNVIAQAKSHFGGIDILVNNAGGSPGVFPIVDESEDFHRHVIDLNVTSTWAGMRAAIPEMKTRGGGAIVNISSIDGLAGVGGMTSYTAAKFAITGMTKTVALEVGQFNIRVNSVHPGVIATPLVKSVSDAVMKRLERALAWQPIPRMGKPEEIAAAVLFFASDESTYCTGTSLVVDGGHLAGPPREPVED